jgi:phosphohistidine swiveling domain-containing protein
MVETSPAVVSLAEAATLPVSMVGGKAATLARLAAAGLTVPPGIVVTAAAWSVPAARLTRQITGTMRTELPGEWDRFAVRSSAAAEDLPTVSYAGQYETSLDVPASDVPEAVLACREAATSARVSAYRGGLGGGSTAEGFAVLVQPMVRAVAAGVAFTADPVTGNRDEVHVTAVRGLGEAVVSGMARGDEWRVRDRTAVAVRVTEDAITAADALAIARLAGRVQAIEGRPQDLEWALTANGSAPGRGVVLLQSRPMTALPEPADWSAPGPGFWMRNFRLGEWLPEPLTPLFADWLLPAVEDGYLDGMRDTVGAVVPFRHAVVNGWYYNAIPRPRPGLLLRAVRDSRGRILLVVFNALIRVSRDPAAASRALLDDLHEQWRDTELPAYRAAIFADAHELEADPASDPRDAIDNLGRLAGRQLWYLSIVGGSTWKMEDRLNRSVRRHLADLTARAGPLADGAQVLLRALPGAAVQPGGHAVLSADWYWPTAGEDRAFGVIDTAVAADRHARLADERQAAEAACHQALDGRPRVLHAFDELLEVTRRYTVIREQQAATLTLAWPQLRVRILQLGGALAAAGRVDHPEDVFFLLRGELGAADDLGPTVRRRRESWEAQRRLAAPLTLGQLPGAKFDPISRAVSRARGEGSIPDGAIVGQPASAGRVAGTARIVTGPDQFDSVGPGEVIVATTTTPAWTPLFATAAAVVTDGGTLAAHASIVAREYGIPAVVGTGDATRRISSGTTVTVDGTRGFVTTGRAISVF